VTLTDSKCCEIILAALFFNSKNKGKGAKVLSPLFRLMNPLAQEWFNRALQLHQAGRFSEAEDAYDRVLTDEPEHADSLHNIAIIANDAGELERAETLLRQVIRLQPEHALAYSALSNLLRLSMRYEESLEASEKSLFYQNDSAKVHFNYGVTLHTLHRFSEAEAAFRRAIRLDSNFVVAHSRLGAVLTDQGDGSGAVAAYRQALVLDPHFLDAHNNLGIIYMACGHWEEALRSFKTANEIKPNDADILCNMANAYRDLFQLDSAIELYRRALDLMPARHDIHSNLLLSLNYHSRLQVQEIFEAHGHWEARHAALLPVRTPPVPAEHAAGKRLRLGFISPDFRSHSVAFFLMPFLEELDRSQFEVICYSDVQLPDAVTRRFEQLAHSWQKIAPASMRDVTELVRADEIDILFDLAGHTAWNRLPLFAQKPAAIQIAWLGYPNTTGLAAMDYRITDAVADPPGATEHLHTERLVRLPVSAWCYRAPEVSPPVVPLPALASGYVTFGSCNSMVKINEDLLTLWAEILGNVPGSRLYLKNKSVAFPQVQERIRKWLMGRGIEGHRLMVCPKLDGEYEHLEQYGRMDISLDTYPYHGTTTTCESLWMGVPVVTLAGDSHRSRVSASLLSQIGHGEWVAESRERYVTIASALAADLPGLSQTRLSLREQLRQSPLMDEVRFTRDMEVALKQIWSQTTKGE
jgi:protein O-GlcNAc transferase